MERQNTQELYWSFDDEEHNEDSTKKSDQISTEIASGYCKWFINFNLSVLINKNSSFRLVQHLHWRLLVTLSHLMQMKSVKIVCWGSFRSHSGHRVTSCYHQTAGRCKFLDIQKDQILLGCFTVCFSPSFPAVYAFILAEWGPCGGWNLECCGNLFQTVRKSLSTKSLHVLVQI